MTSYVTKVSKLLFVIVLATTLTGGLTTARADEKGSGLRGMHKGIQHHGGHMVGKQGCMHGKGMQGKHRDDKHMLGVHWKTTLTDKQKAQLDTLHVQFARTKAPLKAGVKAMKMQLTVMAVSDQPGAQTIDAKLNELLMAKRELLRAKYTYIAAQRQVLTPPQQVSFDMDVLHKAMHGRKDKGHHGGKKH